MTSARDYRNRVRNARGTTAAAAATDGNSDGGDTFDGNSSVPNESGSEPANPHSGNGEAERILSAPVLPLGDNRDGAGDGISGDSSRSTGTAPRAAARNRNRNNRNTTAADAGTTETPDNGAQAFPRSVDYQDPTREPKQSVELIGDAYGALFFLASLLFGDHWTLDELEAKELAHKTRSFVTKLGKKRSKAILDLLDGPLFSFLILLTVLASVAFPRWRKTIAIAKQRATTKANASVHAQSEASDTASATNGAAKPATDVPNDARAGIDERLRPVSPADIADDSSADVAPLH